MDENDKHTDGVSEQWTVQTLGENDNKSNKQILSGRPNRRVLTSVHERKQTKNKNETNYLRAVARERALRTIEQTDLHLFQHSGAELTWHQAL